MKILCGLMMMLVFRQAVIAGIVRKPPAFSTPVYSDSYLPAAMQVIFHAVEQLKLLQSEEVSQEHLTAKPSSTIQSMKHPQPQPTTPGAISTVSATATTRARDEVTETPCELSSAVSPAVIEASTSRGSTETYDNLTKAVLHAETSTAGVPIASAPEHEESSEMNEETTETNYATPETNHESPESVHETQETNQEIPEKSEEVSSTGDSIVEISEIETSLHADVSRSAPSISQTSDGQRKKAPTVDTVVDEIYGILKPTISPLIEESDVTDESKDGISIEKMESIEDEEEETRFTLLGERVTQVPRPSLSSYLRRAKVPPGRALQQLASLYDALSKDARKQGYARFAGYSDEVLTILQSSAEGGAGPQLKRLLEKMIERNELTRDDARTKTSNALRDLDDPASSLSKDLRRLLPLRYAA